MDRRATFFLGAAVACFLLVPLADGYAWVAATVGAVYVLLALGSWLDAAPTAASDPGRAPAARAITGGSTPGADQVETRGIG